jgi:hypothetical protein
MDKTAVLQQKTVKGSPINPASLEGKVFQISARINEAVLVPSFAKLHTTPQVKVFDERTGRCDDVDESICSDVSVEVARIEIAPQLAVEAHGVPRLGYSRTPYDLFWFQVLENVHADLCRHVAPEVELWSSLDLLHGL